MFKWLYELLGAMMSFFSSITGSYILALLFYALIFKIVFLPFTIKQQKNQIKMAKLAPKIQLIKAKYKGRNDQASMQKQQQEIMDLQQKEGYNGCSGCMPMLIQLPIIMLLYAVIQSPLSYMTDVTDTVEYHNDHYEDEGYVVSEELAAIYGEGLYTYDEKTGEKSVVEITDEMIIGKLKDRYLTAEEKEDKKKTTEIYLIGKIYNNLDEDKYTAEEIATEIASIESFGMKYDSIPNFRLFGVNLAATPTIIPFTIITAIPFLAAISSWLTMFLSRKLNGNSNPAAAGQDQASDQARKSMMIMDLIMPLMTLFIAFGLSGMLGLYWIIQSILGLLQTFIMSRAMPVPRFTEEELRELRRQEKEVEKAARAAAKVTRHRSLHYIDEDDYDELPTAPQNENGKKNEGFKGDAPELKD